MVAATRAPTDPCTGRPALVSTGDSEYKIAQQRVNSAGTAAIATCPALAPLICVQSRAGSLPLPAGPAPSRATPAAASRKNNACARVSSVAPPSDPALRPSTAATAGATAPAPPLASNARASGRVRSPSRLPCPAHPSCCFALRCWGCTLRSTAPRHLACVFPASNAYSVFRGRCCVAGRGCRGLGPRCGRVARAAYRVGVQGRDDAPDEKRRKKRERRKKRATAKTEVAERRQNNGRHAAAARRVDRKKRGRTPRPAEHWQNRPNSPAAPEEPKRQNRGRTAAEECDAQHC